MSEKLVLIDGHSILNRAFYGVPDLTNAEGLHTNAIYGFLNILFKILEEEKPRYLAVAFDVHAPTFRHEIYEAYKGTRSAMPQELREQVPVMKEVLQAMGVVILEQAGLEADDILGTIAKKAEESGKEVALVSGDRDLLQIASDHIKIRIPKTRGGKTEIADYYAADVLAAYQVTPAQFIELKALMGDASDNIPGVPGIGEKTATNLMVEYGSIDNIYAHLEEIGKKSVRETLAANRELAELSRVLATIRTDCELELDYGKAVADDFYTPEAYHWFKKLEFKNMLSRFEQRPVESQPEEEGKHIFCEEKELLQLLQELTDGTEGRVGLWLLTDGVRSSSLLAVAVSLPDGSCYACKVADEERMTQALQKLSGAVPLAMFDGKRMYNYLDRNGTERYFDILIAAYLLNPLKNDYDAETIAKEHLDKMIPGYGELFGKLGHREALLLQEKEVLEYMATGAEVARRAALVLEQKLSDTGMDKLMSEIEMPLSLVLYEMEKEGVAVRRRELYEYGESLSARIAQLEASIHEQAGQVFNINSPKQLGEILFEKMKLPGGKKTKTGYSTAADVLEKMANDHPIVKDILEYRGLTKLKSTYAEGLADCIEEDGRIHTTFNQTITATGRISSTEPNLQNIPTRTRLGREIRKVFVAGEGCVLADADYSQIELRVLAHMSGDEQLIEAYHMDQDIHRITAAKVFHTPFEEVTDLQRRNAKAVNFGIVYGISSFGLSQDLSISRKEAEQYIEQYFATYPKVKEFLQKLVEDTKQKGYVATLYGRRRPVPELASSNFMQRSFGERVAMNSPIQGTAADIMKIAMIRVHKALKEAGLRSKLILQVHDELLIETYLEEKEQVCAILADNMRAAAQLAVTLEVDLHTGANWYEAK